MIQDKNTKFRIAYHENCMSMPQQASKNRIMVEETISIKKSLTSMKTHNSHISSL